MERMGLDVPPKDVDALFDSWDPDGSGSLDFKELQKGLRRNTAKENWQKSGAKVKSMTKMANAAKAFSMAPGMGRSSPGAGPSSEGRRGSSAGTSADAGAGLGGAAANLFRKNAGGS